MDYHSYINSKLNTNLKCGFSPHFIPDYLFDFQKYLVEWSIVNGRSLLIEDCGLGKTVQELIWGTNVYKETGKPVLHLTPLAVSKQTVDEANKFGIDAGRSKDGQINFPIVITNYEKLHLYNYNDFGGVVCDESSILKNFDGKYKSLITEFMRKVQYRLLGTATAAPNDFIELGTSAEALGHLGYIDMLGRFFKNDNDNVSVKRMYGEAPKWRFKKHAELPFWRWVTSWARAIRKPSDLGFDNGGFNLTELHEHLHIVDSETLPDGYFLPIHASNLPEQREEKKRTVKDRCEKVAELVNSRGDQSTCWCQLNDEGDLLEKLIPNSVQVHGGLTDEIREEIYEEFSSGNIQRIITKPKIGAFGLNWQNCCHSTYFPSHSYEQKYQLVRRHWRFGQKNDVVIDIVATEGERKILNNINRKHDQAVKMFENLVSEMNNSLKIKRTIEHTSKMELPIWLS